MRYITRPTNINYSVFDRQEEETFMDNLTPDQAEELASKLNSIGNISTVVNSSAFINLQDYFKNRKDKVLESREIFCFCMDHLTDAVSSEVEKITESIIDKVTDHLTYELDLTDPEFDEATNAVRNACESSFESLLDTELEKLIRQADDNDLYLGTNVEELVEDIESMSKAYGG